MTVAAFVVSLLSLIIAGIAVIYARRSAAAAESNAQTNARRNAREEKALFDAAAEQESALFRLELPKANELRLTNLGPATATVVSLQSPDVAFSGLNVPSLELQPGNSINLGVHGATPSGFFECTLAWTTSAGAFNQTTTLQRP
jgi:hypothetical protein